MPDEPKTQGWWQTLPGILTATAGIITAVAGLLGVLYQAGFFRHETPAVASSTSSRPAAPDAPLNVATAPRVEPAKADVQATAPSPAGRSPPGGKSVNLLSADNGGQLIVASGDDWAGTIDGKESFNQISYGLKTQTDAVYAFKDEKPATIEMFTMLIPGTDDSNVKEFELFAGNDTPTGSFQSIGVFKTLNVKLFKTPYQEFRFAPVKARYLRIKLLSTYGATHPNVEEVQLFGRLESK